MIDTHAHLMFPEFEEDIGQVILRAKEAGISGIINVGCGAEASRKSVEMADGQFLFASVGLHPYDSLEVTEDLMREWEELAKNDSNIVAIGETGLDYFKSDIDPEKQQHSFRLHLELAKSVDLPVIVHNRDADEDCLKVLKEFPGVRAVFHCYGSNLDFARAVWEAGYLTSFTGIITYPNAEDLRKVVVEVPNEMFMTETDCPYLAPQTFRGKRNEPSYVAEVVKKIAEVKAMDVSEIDKISTENAERFFGLE
ncbi:MAG: TatD family hydrolase [bacterium]|nr:TatD family hydrolase [bacterium]